MFGLPPDVGEAAFALSSPDPLTDLRPPGWVIPLLPHPGERGRTRGGEGRNLNGGWGEVRRRDGTIIKQ